MAKQDVNILDQMGAILKSEVIEPAKGSAVSLATAWLNNNISKSQQILVDKNRNASLRLSQSIGVNNPEYLDNGMIDITVEAMEYWKYVDEGVNGMLKKYGSPHNFTDRQPSTADILMWMREKKIYTMKYRSETGELVERPLVTPEDYNAAAYVIGRAIKRNGLEPSNFITDVFTKESINELTKEIANIWQ